jgi:hypothetical protein
MVAKFERLGSRTALDYAIRQYICVTQHIIAPRTRSVYAL